jgi:hypothetical protein
MAPHQPEWLPKLVVAPSSCSAFLFIYGLMAWNGYLSVSASRLLPNYEFVGLEQYETLWESERWWVALKNLASSAACSCRRRHGARVAAGRAAGPEDPCRRRAAHRLPVPDGAELHRHRHGLEVDPQSRPGPGTHGARVGL